MSEIITKETRNSLLIIDGLKEQVDIISQNCLQIQVVDDSTLAIAQQNLSKANSLATTIEAKRTEIKKPVLEAGKLIDSTCKAITTPLEKAVAHLKSQVMAWEEKKRKEEKEKQEAVTRKLEEEKRALEAENKRKQDIRDYINGKASDVLKSCLAKSVTVKACQENIAMIERHYKPRAFFQEFADEAYTLKEQYLGLIKAKLEQLQSEGSISEAQAEINAQKAAIEAQRIELARKEAEIKQREENERLAKELAEKEEQAKLEAERLAAEAAADKTKGIRYTWGFELADINQVSLNWLILDDAVVKAYIKENKDKLQEGEFNGVRFFKKMGVVA